MYIVLQAPTMVSSGGGGRRMSFPHRLAPHWRHRFVCHVCWEAASGLLLHCHDCQMDVHVACCASADISLSDTTHVSHPQHPLSLLHVIRHVDHQCDGCGATSGDGADLVFYSCRPCGFDLCGLCVRAPVSITHPGHPHLLALAKNRRPCTACNGCGESSQLNQLMYRCNSCDFDLHLSCVRLPQQLEHPHHPGHTLSLRMQSTSRRCRCCVCGDDTSSTWAYACEACRFYMHPKCSGMEHRGALLDSYVPATQDDPYINLLSHYHYNDPHRLLQLPTTILDHAPLHNTTTNAEHETINTLSLVQAISRRLPPSLTARDADALERVIALLRIGGSS